MKKKTCRHSKICEECEIKHYQKEINDKIEFFEDKYQVDFSKRSEQGRKNRLNFLETIEQYATKDKKGNILNFNLEKSFKKYCKNYE